jgi:tripartite-type tricarboxylate transporter receptor subunit TctC
MLIRLAQGILQAATAALLLATTSAWAQDWPRQTVRIVVPFPAGGGTDVLARAIAERLAPRLGQSVIIDNRAGASGNIGTAFVSKAPPDGHTLLFHITFFPTYKLTFTSPGYDAFADFVPIGTVASSPSLLVVNSTSPWHTLADVVDSGKRQRVINYASAGTGAPQHLAMAHLAKDNGMRAEHIAYKGTSAALPDLMGSNLDLVSGGLGSLMTLLEARRLRAIALLAPRRSSLLPDLPTAAEAGFPSIDSSVRFLLLAPAKTPRSVIDRLNRELTQALSDPALRADFAKVGFEPLESTPEQAGAMMKSEYETMAPIIQSLKLEKQ